MTDPWQGREGVEMVPLGANKAQRLSADEVLVVASGLVHLFWQPDRNIRRTTYISRSAGEAFLGLREEGLVVAGSPGTQVARMSRETFLRQSEAAALLADWIGESGRILTEPLEEVVNIEPGRTVTLEPGQEVSAQHPLFLSSSQALEFDGQKIAGSLLALPPLLRGRATVETEVEGLSVEEALQRADLWQAIDRYHDWVYRRLKARGLDAHHYHQEKVAAHEAARDVALNQGIARLSTALPGRDAALVVGMSATEPLMAAIEMVARATGIESLRPPIAESENNDLLTRIAQASGFRTRTVKLPPNWWKSDAGPLLGSRDGKPVALLPDRRPGRYRMVDPESGESVRVTSSVAKAVDFEAYVFYRPMPHDCVNFTRLLKFAWRDVGRDIFLVFVVCILGAIVGMAMPIGLGWLVGTVIPSGQRTELIALGLGLGMATVVSTTSSIAQSIASLRIGSRVDAVVQAAMTDRLLGLPAPFFRRYSSGDLTNRLLGFQALVKATTGSMLTAVLSTLMSTTNLALMFYYDFWLALIGVLGVSLLLIFLMTCSWFDLHYQRSLAHMRGEISALVFQLIGGVTKLKVAAAQARAFERWSRTFTARVRTSYRSSLIQSNVNSIMSVYNTASLIIFIGYLAHYKYTALSTSNFLALIAAYGSFVGAVNSAASSLTSMLTTVPLAERFAPILAEAGEVVSDRPNPGVLKGRVEVSHVSFRYGPDEPFTLKDVSLYADPGEFIAVVGPSGSGKSTLLRQLLGFDHPTQGRVLYDGQDLAGVNVQAVRRQLGVVLQNGQLMPGSILANIIGSSLLSLDDAWQAAEVAGIAEDIRAMPMGMQTFVAEGGGAFSGGQKQRLLIARAVVAKPRLILLDEATSALDSRTQEQVSRQLNELQATRVVIAHRLSTIEKADRIYVLKDGVIEQVGTYEELMAVPGHFRDLAKRQLL